VATETPGTAPAPSPEDNPTAQRRLAAVNAAADAKPTPDDQAGGLTAQQVQDATDWFLSDSEESEGYVDFELNVVNTGFKWVRFRAGALPRERINQIREQNTITVPDPETGKETKKGNEAAINLRIAAEGLLSPNLKDPNMRKVRGQDFFDPADALQAKFAHKPGLIDQITGYVIDASGYNDEDSREVRAGKS
jgi:hypothetical protein